MQNQKYIGIVGSRILPDFYALALDAILLFGRSEQGIIFSAWQNICQFPASVKEKVKRFVEEGGKIDWGCVPLKAGRSAVVTGLLGRNVKLVSGAGGIVAYLHGESRGTCFTIKQAVKRRIPVIAFLNDDCALPNLPNGFWRKLQNQEQFRGGYSVAY